MTKDARFKRAVRDRMAATGESYSQARTALLATNSDGEPVPTWERLVALEPRLAELDAAIRQIDDQAKIFCANRAWERGGYRKQLVQLVGWVRGAVDFNPKAGLPGPRLRVLTLEQLGTELEPLEALSRERKIREERAGLGVLWTQEAYEVAYAHLYGLLPPCRDCSCF